MQYFGGKFNTAKYIAEYINTNLHINQTYWEPFVGSGYVLEKIDNNRKRIASDFHKELISMWKSLQNGWIPPEEVSEELYRQLKLDKSEGNLALKAFVGFGCSFAGKYWGGYAKNKQGQKFARNAKNTLLKTLPKIIDVKFYHCDFFKIGINKPVENYFFYLDPPYGNTTGYSLGKFDNEKFWEHTRFLSRENDVVVSEYNAPDDFECVLEIKTRTHIRDKNGNKTPRIEKLFKWKKYE